MFTGNKNTCSLVVRHYLADSYFCQHMWIIHIQRHSSNIFNPNSPIYYFFSWPSFFLTVQLSHFSLWSSLSLSLIFSAGLISLPLQHTSLIIFLYLLTFLAGIWFFFFACLMLEICIQSLYRFLSFHPPSSFEYYDSTS